MTTIKDDIISYREMCDIENVQTLQRGMNYRLNHSYSVILMSQRSNAPYNDKIHDDGVTIEYEGHNVIKRGYEHNPKLEDQPSSLPTGVLTQNGKFIQAVKLFKKGKLPPEQVKVYEKIIDGVWSLKGFFDLVDYNQIHDGTRFVYKFILKLSYDQKALNSEEKKILSHTRVITSSIKKEVWMRDKGKCVLCGSAVNLHFDHDLPYSKGGTSLSAKNVRLLCMKHNLEKSTKIE